MPPRAEILAVGGLDRDLRPVYEHYVRLLRPWLTLETREVREVALKGRAPAEVLREEGRRLLAAWPSSGTVVALTVDGAAHDSPGFAAALERWLERGRVTFVVGGSLGLADEVVARAAERLSLSPLTMPHQLVRVVLAEQLFRGLSIRRGHPYHH
ncbi:MAG: 23S rRNA (pseudouridine(1915)-N(3))-methyltransferase RlmH [Thermoleophilia bacterium]|nr:23S rRNA (pseudouridine(1915)-N(3))-methyltransferase RlmH [Thermoleophilia bacterium]